MKKLLGNTRRADLVFSKSGKIEINAFAARALSLADGDVIGLCETDGELFVYVASRAADTIGRHRGVCRRTNRRGMHFRTYSADITAEILARCGMPSSAAIPVGETVQSPDFGTMLTLIIRNNLSKKPEL